MASLAPTNGMPYAGRASRERTKWTKALPNPMVWSWFTQNNATSDIGLSSNSGGGIRIVPPIRHNRNPASNNGGSVRWARNANDSTLVSRPVSSHTSRLHASVSVSPTSTVPPGSDHSLRTDMRCLTSRIRSFSKRIPVTLTLNVASSLMTLPDRAPEQ